MQAITSLTLKACALAVILLAQSSLVYAKELHAISIFGKPKYPENFRHLNYVNPNAKKGGSIKFATIGTFNSLNPYILKGVSAQGIGFINDSLMTQTEDDQFASYGLIAKSVSIQQNPRSITFTLRKIAKCQDGTQITAQDVANSYNTFATKSHPALRISYKQISDVKIINKFKIKFNIKQTATRDIEQIIGAMPILCKGFVAAQNFTTTSANIPTGSGAYKIKSFDFSKNIVYEKVKNYWGENLPINIGRNNFDEIHYKYYQDYSVAIEAFKAEQYDLRHENVSKNWFTSYNIPQIKDGRVVKEEIAHKVPTSMQAFIFNTRKDILSDITLRQAISNTFDFEWTNKALFYSAYKRNKSYFENTIFASTGTLSNSERNLLLKLRKEYKKEGLINNETFSTQTSQPNVNIKQRLRSSYNMLKAKGYYVLNNALYNKSGKKIAIEFLIEDKSTERVILPFMQNLKKLGISVKIKIVEESQYQNLINKFNYDIIIGHFFSGNLPGAELIGYWHSSTYDEIGSSNFVGANSKLLDHMVQTITSKNTPPEKLTTYTKALDRILLSNHFVVPHYYLNYFRIVYWNKFSKPAITPDFGLGISSWWTKESAL